MRNRPLLRAAKYTVLLVMAALLVAGAAITMNGLTDDLSKSDVGLVLGSKVELDGQPSARLAARLDRAVILHAQGVFKHIVVSGGTGVEGFDEAAVMRDYLVRKGVPLKAIIVDSDGVTTDASARNCAAIMQKFHYSGVTVVTQYFHVPRAKLALRQLGVTDIRSAHAHFAELRDVYAILREIVALPAYWLKSRH